MTYRRSFLGCLFLFLAIALALCEVLGVYEYVTENPTSAYVAIGSCIIAAVTPGLPAIGDWFARTKGWRYALIAWLGFALCLSIVLLAAIQRTGSATDAAAQLRARSERASKIAEQAARDARDDYDVAQRAAVEECKSGRAKKCLDAEAKAESARQVRARAGAALSSAPAGEQADPLASRLAAFLPLSEPQIRLLLPLQVPIALSLLSVLFFAGWTRLDLAPATGEPQNAPPVAPVVSSGRPQLAIVPKPAAKFGAVAAFLVSRTEPAPGEAIEIEGVMYNDYKAWCASVGVSAHPPGQFARELAGVGKASGMLIEIRGKEAYCLDRRLAA